MICNCCFGCFLVARWDGTGEIAFWMGKKTGHAMTENRWTEGNRTSNCARAECDTTVCEESTNGREHSGADGSCDGDEDVLG